ncbi:MAG: N-acetylneuraminate synthase [Acidimicrobiia bacterium]
MRDSFDIAGRQVGAGAPCYIVAEAGANHDRDFYRAKQLIDVAAEAGCDAVKFQTYTGSDLYSKFTPPFEYLKDISTEPPAQLLDRIALPQEWQPRLKDYADFVGITWFSSPFDFDAVDALETVGVPCYKIASFEILDLDLVRKCASTGKPLIISTGMATLGEIEDALGVCESEGNDRVALLHCVSSYPASPHSANLRAMETIRRAFGVPTGFSDHTLGIVIPIAAAALGADIIEKHFTVSRNLKGPDHPFALEPNELKAMVEGVRAAEAALGDGRKRGPTAEESGEMYTMARRSIVAKSDIPAGTVITREMLTSKRPGYGIKPKYIRWIVGRVAKRDIKEDEVITEEMI